jgi:putative sigma-54 modulation protein
MTIEFFTAAGKVPEKLVSDTRNEILRLSNINKDISRAEVILKEEEAIEPENKVCEIRLTIYDDNLMSYSRTDRFEKSVKEATKELKKMVKRQTKEKEMPPGEMTTTVKV